MAEADFCLTLPLYAATMMRRALVVSVLPLLASLLAVRVFAAVQTLTLPTPPQTSTTPAPSVPQISATQAPPTLTPRVLARYPHDPAAFTEGFEWMAGTLFESTGLVGESSIRRTELPSGQVTQRRAPPSNKVFAEGLSVLKNVVYQLTWKDGLVYLYDAQNLKSLGELKLSGEGWGLTNDGQQLIMSNGSNTLSWRDPVTFEQTKSVRVTAQGVDVTNLNELEYVNGSVYANVWLSNKLARINPASGRVTAWLDVSELTRQAQAAATEAGTELGFDDVPNGVAYDAQKGTLLLTGKRWPLVFEVALP